MGQHAFQITLTDEKEIRMLIALFGMGFVWAQLLNLHKQALEEAEVLPIENPFKDAMDLLMEHMPKEQNTKLWGAHLTLQAEPHCTFDDANDLWMKLYTAYGAHFGYLRDLGPGEEAQ